MHNPKIGVLIAQLGTPEAPTPGALRRYLREFLADPRVIEFNRLAWWFILQIILLVRPRRSAKLYQRIWTEQGSPLLLTSNSVVRKLQAVLDRDFSAGRFKVALGMRYGQPAIASAIDDFCQLGVERVLIFPMYPQYSGPTTASTYDAAFKALLNRRVVPAVRVVPPYFRHPLYLNALAASIRDELAKLDWQPEKIIVTYHGVPKRYVTNGDPYQLHCGTTTCALAEELGWQPDDYVLSFQSRFGSEEWLQPYTDQVIAELGRQGLKRIAAVCPAFTADCLETIDEIGHEGLKQFQAAGGEQLHLIPCLNDHDDWVQAMKQIALQELRGWLEDEHTSKRFEPEETSPILFAGK